MLQTLTIHNFGLIDAVTLELASGLTVMTGETGAGKSMVIQALGSLLSERAQPEFVRHGAESATIEATFYLSAEHPAWEAAAEASLERDPEGLLILRREIPASGPSRSTVNGARVVAKVLTQVAETVLDITGQFEHQSLLRRSTHRQLLDAFARHDDQLTTFAEQYRHVLALRESLAEAEASRERALQQKDRLEQTVKEIDALDPKPGELETLKDQVNQMTHHAEIQAEVEKVADTLFENDAAIGPTVEQLIHGVGAAADLDSRLAGPLNALREVSLALESVRDQLRPLRDAEPLDADQLDALNQRLNSLQGLVRKYGDDLDHVIAERDRAAADLATLDDDQESLEALRLELQTAVAAVQATGQTLTQSRRAAGQTLCARVADRLQALAMPKASLDVALRYFRNRESWYFFQDEAVSVDSGGPDQVELQFSANPGEPVKPLASIASGGELSRVLLALKAELAQMDSPRTTIFDEVDTGIGGDTASKVGRMLAEIATSRQVLCITHSPQVAAFGDQHIQIAKQEAAGKTHVEATQLDPDARVDEVARMVSGENRGETARQHARELIASSQRR